MTVADLIAQLQTLPMDAIVITPSHQLDMVHTSPIAAGMTEAWRDRGKTERELNDNHGADDLEAWRLYHEDWKGHPKRGSSDIRNVCLLDF